MNALEYGKYYYCKKTNETMRYDGSAMQLWEGDEICRTNTPPLEEIEEVTWGTQAIPLKDFYECEYY